VGGMGWMIGFFSLAALSGDWLALAALTVAGIGSGAFHPTGTMVASQVSAEYRSRATAVFFMSGQLGLFLGPILAGFLLEGYGRPAYLVLPFAAFIAFFSGWQWVTNTDHHTHAAQAAQMATAVVDTAKRNRRALLLAIIILSTGTTGFAASSFAPKFFIETGYAEGYIGLLTGLYMGGSAIGNVIGGFLGDRIKAKWVIALATFIAVLPVYFYVPAAGAMRFVLLALAGFFVGMPHSLLVLSVQGLFPKRRAMGSGIALGFMFFGSSIGSYGLGFVADSVGLATVLQGTAVLPLIAAVAAALLPSDD
ncbi:MAG: MFS transporter, partial [Anaerolineales bacterium]|nr:MFS transporter [Anaerolineales bacterium]